MKTRMVMILLMAFAVSCTKTDKFYEENTISSIGVNTTAAEKAFSVWLDDELLEDSVNSQRGLSTIVIAGEHRLRIAQAGTTNYFVDKTMPFDWTTTRPARSFSLIELDPQKDPMVFDGFPDNLPAPENGFMTISIVNLDKTFSANKTIDILLYDISDPELLLVELKNIPYGEVSDYFKISTNDFYNGGMMVIRESGTDNILLDGRPNWMILSFSINTYTGNTFLFKLSNDNGTEYPYYTAMELFGKKR